MRQLIKIASYKNPDEPMSMKEIRDELMRRKGNLTTDVDSYINYLDTKFDLHTDQELKDTWKRQTGKTWEKYILSQ